ncbi:MAG TPA: class II aldolase/adducin family protein [Candidatus Binatia bacterium]|nr:class II aldolase/adducin family protein [Candidatus Binatia bacterium]
MDLETLKQQVRFGARSLQRKLNDIWGHVSARLPSGSGQEGFMLAHLRIPFKPAPPDELYCFDYQGRLLEGTGQVPWEIPLYTNIYRMRPDVGSVVHAHPPLTIALGISGETIRPVHQLSACFAAGVPTFGGELINSEELGKKVAATLGDKRAILLVGHGAVTVGADVPEAVTTALLMEETARLQLLAAAAGKVQTVPPEILNPDIKSAARFLWRFLEWEEESGAAPLLR